MTKNSIEIKNNTNKIAVVYKYCKKVSKTEQEASPQTITMTQKV